MTAATDNKSALAENRTGNPHILIGGSGVQEIVNVSSETKKNPVYDQILERSFFDWYAGTVFTNNLKKFVNLAKAEFDCDVANIKPVPPYENGYEFCIGDTQFFRAYEGGHNEGIYVIASGHRAPKFSQWIRKRFPNHQISRMDAAIDFDEPGLFDIFYNHCQYLASKYRVTFDQKGDYRPEHLREGGRTVSLGSRKSPVYIRIYEKGYEQLEKENDTSASLDWVRVEVEFKPKNSYAKRVCAGEEFSPAHVFSVNDWVKDLTTAMGDHKVVPLKIGTIHKKSDRHRSFSHMIKQYGRIISETIQEDLNGDGRLLYEYILDHIKISEQQKQRSRKPAQRAERRGVPDAGASTASKVGIL